MYRDRKGNFHKKPVGVVAKKRESAYGIFIQDSKVLLAKPSWVDVWEFPGGGKDQNEDLFGALKREFLEETGFEMLEFEKNPIHTILAKFYADDLDEYFDSQLNFFMISRLGNQNKKMIQGNEIVDVRYVPISELNKENMHNVHLEVLDLFMNR